MGKNQDPGSRINIPDPPHCQKGWLSAYSIIFYLTNFPCVAGHRVPVAACPGKVCRILLKIFFFFSNIFLEVDKANNIKLFQIFPPEKAKVHVKSGTVNAYRYLIHGVLDPEWPPRNRKWRAGCSLRGLEAFPEALEVCREVSEEITNFVGTVPYLFIKKVEFIV